MLLFSREYTDGMFSYVVIPIDQINLVKVIDKSQKKILKEYETEDDEAALYIYQTLLDNQERFGLDAVRKFKLEEALPGNLMRNVRILVEDTPMDYDD